MRTMDVPVGSPPAVQALLHCPLFTNERAHRHRRVGVRVVYGYWDGRVHVVGPESMLHWCVFWWVTREAWVLPCYLSPFFETNVPVGIDGLEFA